MTRHAGVALLAAIVAVSGCRGGGEPPPPGEGLVWLVPAGGEPAGEIPDDAGAVAIVEIAADEVSRERGLMDRESLAEDAGMLFVYPREEERTFWMKNTRIPLSIAFADSRGRIVRIRPMSPGVGIPDGDLELYPSDEPAKYALEMNQGWFAVHGIREGDRIGLSDSLVGIEPR